MIHPSDVPILQDQLFDAEKLAGMMVDHLTNEKGEILARVWETKGFQEVYDYKGYEKERMRLKRKAEQVYNQTNSTTHLFQKVYYHPELLADDEVTLRQLFVNKSSQHDSTQNFLRLGFFVGYFPATYCLSRTYRAGAIALFTLGYYGVH